MQYEPTTPYGYCKCGCGQRTKLAKDTNRKRGHVRGEPISYVHGHHARKPVHWIAEDRGYETPCWIWQLHTNKDGHGRVTTPTGFVMAHRPEYERVHGPLPGGVHLHHLCEVPPCVNPEHLEPVSPAEHRQRHSRLLTPEDVRAIKAKRADHGTTYQALADEYGISQTMAWQICKGLTWIGVGE